MHSDNGAKQVLKRSLQRQQGRARPPAGGIVILLSVVVINLLVFALGAYFFYDQIIAPGLGLKSPEEQLQDATQISTSAFRVPEEQMRSMDRMYELQPQVSAELFASAVSTVNRLLPGMTVAAEVIDHWLELEKAAQGISSAVEYSAASGALADWRGNDPSRSAARQRLAMRKPLDCGTEMRQLIEKMLGDGAVSEIERQIAGAALATGRLHCGW